MPSATSNIYWRPEFATAFPDIDQEHRTLVGQLRSMETAIQSRCSREVICRFLGEFADAVVRHFETEERAMEHEGTPLLEGHRAEHEAFLHQLQQLSCEYERTGTLPFQAVLASLWAWTEEHLSGRDVIQLVRHDGAGETVF